MQVEALAKIIKAVNFQKFFHMMNRYKKLVYLTCDFFGPFLRPHALKIGPIKKISFFMPLLTT